MEHGRPASPRRKQPPAVPASGTFTSMSTDRRRFWSRFALAGPVAFVCATLLMAGGALWLPGGRAEIDNLVLPIVLFPAIWAGVFFYAMLDRRIGRAWLILAGLSVVHAGMIATHVIGTQA
jgi:hypothetical protein